MPLGRVGEPDDVARVVCFLLGDDAAYLSGQLIRIGLPSLRSNLGQD